MKKLLLAIICLLLFFCYAGAAVRLPRPSIGAPAFVAVTNGFAASFKDGSFTSPYEAVADNESSSGTMVRKLTGLHEDGQIAQPVNVSANTYFAWVKLRLRGVTQIKDGVAWFNTSPFVSGFQNDKATLITAAGLPPSPSFGWVQVGANLDMATFVQGTAQASFSLASGSVLYAMTNPLVEPDCLFISTDSNATPICPEGEPSSTVTFDAIGTGAGGSAVSSLAPTITVGSNADRILVCGIAHRTSTNTISSVSSGVDGALTLLDWFADAANPTVAGALYYKIAPTAGAHTVTVSFSSAQNASANCISYDGVSQTAPFSATAQAAGVGDPSDSVASSTDHVVIAHVATSTPTSQTIAPGTNQTERWEQSAGVDSQANRISYLSSKQGDASVSMTADISADTNAWIQQTVSLRPPSGVGSAPVLGTPSVTLVGPTSATVEASVDDPSASCEAEYDIDTGAPYANNTVDVGATGGKCIVEITGLSQSTPYFYRINATNDIGTTNSTEGTFDTTTATAVTALGITQAEIDIWNTRRVSGPYKSFGDVQVNSPGDWSRIQSNADSFVSNPTNERWAGQTTDSCFANTGSPINRRWGERLRDAAFVYLVTGNTTYRDAARDELLAQAATAGTDFSDTSRWCFSEPFLSSATLLDINMWLTKLLHGYDYIRHSLSGANQTTLDTWFLNAATFIEKHPSRLAALRFPNRLSDDYSSSPWPQGNCRAAIYLDGPCFYEWHGAWANQEATAIRYVGLAGLLLNNTTLKNSAKRWFKEWMRYSVWYTNSGNIVTGGEYYRGVTQFPGNGWGYVSSSTGDMAILADAFARAGDTELFDYTSSDGFYGSEGGPKSLLGVITTHFRMADHQIIRYATQDGVSDDIIDNFYEPTGWHHIGDTWTAPVVNKFYNDSYLTSVYLRQAPGMPAYPSSPATGGFNAWGGPQGVFPGVLFMFGQMEGLVDPYP